MRLGIDATPLIGQRTGIGVYTRHLIDALAADRADIRATAFTLRGQSTFRDTLPAGVTARSRSVPARLLRECWARFEQPPVELFCGSVDVFHATNYVLPPLRRARGVVTIHDLAYLRFPETVHADSLRYRSLVPKSLARASVVCTISHAVADELAAEYGMPFDRIHVTEPGVDEAWFAATPPTADLRRRLGLPERYVLAVGSLEPRKNLPLLIAAYREWRRFARDTPGLVLAGPAGWGPQLDLASLPVTLTGYLSDVDLRAVMAGASCVAYPSLYEGFGIPPLEALACGVPVVATDLPVSREVLGDAARLVPANDMDALADALDEACAAVSPPDEIARRMARARRYTWADCAAKSLAAYRAALG